MGGSVLEGKVALVTGGASGIGRAIAQTLAEAGAHLAIADLNAPAAEEAAAELTASGPKAIGVVGNVMMSQDVQRMIGETVKAFGRLDILVNNAGLQHVSPITEFSEERWETMIGVMMTGTFLCCKYALPHMIRNRWGRVINMGSTQGKVGTPFKVGYVAAKHGILGLTKVVALEMAEHNITVNALCPAFARTALVEKQIGVLAREHGISVSEVVEKMMTGPAAIHRLLEPKEIASLALYLCSDQAAGITGAALDIDCGWTAR
jgi:3-hydroxybutyrate dehydrogenase